MAIVKPFLCVRPNEAVAHRVAALPYDVYNRQEALEEVTREPLSFLKIDRAETQFGPEVSTYAPCVYDKAAQMLQEAMADGTFVTETEACYFLYELTMDGRSQTGVVGCASVDDYLNEVIKKHEKTRADKEVDRICHVDTCNAQTGPIFLAYRACEPIRDLIRQVKKETPLYDFVSPDGIGHRVWRIAEAERLVALEEGFASLPALYIADGHHRAASAVRVAVGRREANPGYTGEEDFNYFLSVMFCEEELKILDYNRVIKDLNGMTPGEFLTALEEKFQITGCGQMQVHPQNKGELGLFLDGNWYHLTAREEFCVDDPVEGLDVAFLQREVLTPILDIRDPRTDSRIDFVGGIRGLSELERRCSLDMVAAFAMYPTSIGELLDVADAGQLMPPKSTWFEPKLRSGLFIHQI